MRLIAKNMAVLMGSQVATWASSLVLLFLVPGYLGAAQFGQLNFAYSFVGFFGLLAGLGSGQFMTKEVARDPSRLGHYVFNALVMNLLLVEALSVAATGSMYVLARMLGYAPQTVLIVAIACMGLTLGTLNGVLASALQGEQRMGLTSLWNTVSQYAGSIAAVLVVVEHKGLIALALATSSFAVIPLAGNGVRLLRQLRDGARLDLRLWRVLALGGLPFLLWNAALMVYGSIDTPMLKFMAGDTTVGWYAFAYKLTNAPGFLAPLVIAAFFPALSAHGTGKSPYFTLLANRALRFIAFLSAPMAAGLILVAPDAIRLLHSRTDYIHAIPLIQILAVHVPLVGIDMVLGAALIASDRQRQWVVVGCLAAVLNPLINLAAIPLTMRAFGNGAIGAAVVTVATECLMLVGALYLRPQGIFDRPTIGFVLRCLLASALLLAVVSLSGTTWFPAKVALGAVAYAVASLALRTVSVREIQRRTIQIIALTRPRSASSVS